MTAWKCCLATLVLGSTGCAPALGQEAESPLPQAEESLVLPLTLHRGHLLLDVELNGTVLHLTVDNGVLWDQLLLYGGPRIDALDLELDEPAPEAQSANDPPPLASASGLTLSLPGLELVDQQAYITPASSNFAALFPGEDGVISGTLFRRFVVELDFEGLQLSLSPPEGFEYRGDGQEFELESFGVGAYTLACTLDMGDDQTFEVHPVLDLGGLQPLLFFRTTRPDLPLPAGARPAHLGIGWSGHCGEVPELRIGRFRLKEVSTSYTNAVGKLGKECEGLLGPGVFARFRVTFDYSRKRMFLEPNDHFDAPFQEVFGGWQ